MSDWHTIFMIPPDDRTNLNLCEHEPINTPGAIQPHGVLIAVEERGMQIVAVSANANRVFGCGPRSMLKQRLNDYLDKKNYKALLLSLTEAKWSALQPITLPIGQHGHKREKWDAFCHRKGDLIIMEFEAAVPATKSLPYYRGLRSTFGRIHASYDTPSLCTSAANAMREVTQYDRVMVYRFDADWNGEVVAEAIKEGLRPYLGHCYPATDIPSQARDIFLHNWVRMIPDVHYTPIPVRGLKDSSALDMSNSMLRSVSPIHLEYLKNMETHATLTVSLIKEGKLWGLIACHHGSQKNLFHEVRLACELIGKSVSALLSSREHMEEAELKTYLRHARLRFREALEKCGSIREAMQNNPTYLLSLVDAQGAALRVDEKKTWLTAGNTPSRDDIENLAQWLSTHMSDSNPVFSTSKLSEVYSQGKKLRATACGLLAILIPTTDSSFVLWFRPEIVQHKTWAGDPHKHVTYLQDGSVKIEPRHSFEAWKESVSLCALPWKRAEVASASQARNDLIAVDLRLQFRLAQQAIQQRDEFMSMASHELKTPLTSMRLQSQIARRGAEKDASGEQDNQRSKRAWQRIDGGIDRLVRLVDDMLDISRISTGKLAITPKECGIVALADDVVERMRGQFKQARIEVDFQPTHEVFGAWDRLRVEQCLENLLSNALRYGEGSPIVVRAGAGEGGAMLSVHDEGPGIKPEIQQRIFEKFERGNQSVQGLGLGLYICKQIVELHRGSIWVESHIDRGTTFFISLPT